MLLEESQVYGNHKSFTIGVMIFHTMEDNLSKKK